MTDATVSVQTISQSSCCADSVKHNHPSTLFHTRPRRDFTPAKAARYGRPTFPMQKLVRFSPKYKYSRLHNFPFRGAHWQPRCHSVVVQVQGIGRPNDGSDPDAASSFGVYFGKDCVRNFAVSMSPGSKQTQNQALLEGVHAALLRIRDMKLNEWDGRRKEIIIMLDSEYVQKSMEEWVWEWELNDWCKVGTNQLIQNQAVIQSLHMLISQLEGNMNMSVRFWRVTRDDIAGADELAKSVLPRKGV